MGFLYLRYCLCQIGKKLLVTVNDCCNYHILHITTEKSVILFKTFEIIIGKGDLDIYVRFILTSFLLRVLVHLYIPLIYA